MALNSLIQILFTIPGVIEAVVELATQFCQQRGRMMKHYHANLRTAQYYEANREAIEMMHWHNECTRLP